MTDTRLTNEWITDKDDFIDTWHRFLEGDDSTYIEPVYHIVKYLLDNSENGWIVMNDELVYDDKIKACWYGLMKNTSDIYEKYSSEYDISEVGLQDEFVLPSLRELKTSLSQIKSAPFAIRNGRPNFSPIILYKKSNTVQGYDLDSGYLRDTDSGYLVPLKRLTSVNNFSITPRQTFFRWLCLGLVPKELNNDRQYRVLIDLFKTLEIETSDFFRIERIAMKQKVKLLSDMIVPILLNEDKIRADISPYDDKMLYDANQGHWGLWNSSDNESGKIVVKLDNDLVARNPASSIVEGIVGIDFGTKSTVVVYQKDSVNIKPMRVGTGDLAQSIEKHHYENPTVIEFNDLENFIEAYEKQDGRPRTKWSDVTISHTAFNSMMNSPSEQFNSFASDLKQWAGNSKKKVKYVDEKGMVLDLPPFLELSEEDINPIEIYAYYLGLYINNQRNGIFLNYILSFPVTYETEVRQKILNSFEAGIKKSLPEQLLQQKDVMSGFRVEQGASEPAAYAATALLKYGFEPEDDEKIFYGVFDFGGGTTDFDFGIFREANGTKERRYDYAIEHFGASGDRYLGGENLLELLAFKIFQNNKEKLLIENIQFVLPPEQEEFIGSETLLNTSREAKLNTKNLMEKLRNFWEGDESVKDEYNKGSIEVNLIDINGKTKTNFELDFMIEELESILKHRIQKGIDNFFHSLRLAFANSHSDLGDIEKVHVFLAGNSSKSRYLKELFDQAVQTEMQKIKKENSFEIYPPLSNDDNLEEPNGKTGVAHGLITTRKGGDILIIDRNIDTICHDILFKFYLGSAKKGKFKVVIDRNISYGEWVNFIDASIDRFEVYYSSQSIVTTNKISITDNSIKKLILSIDKVDENASVFIRLVEPDTFEYVVAYEDEVMHEKYLGEIKQKTLL